MQEQYRIGGGLDIAGLVGEIRKSLGSPLNKANTVQISTGLLNYDLQAPAKNLYPVNTPLRNRMPRVRGNGDQATRWKSVTAISNGLGFDAMGWVPEGGRAGVMGLTAGSYNAVSYATLGTEINLTYEAWAGAEGFEDEKARNAIRNLQKTMLIEENAILGGNTTVALGTPSAPTIATANTGGTVAHGTYKAKVVLLTYEGYRNWLASGSLIATGVPTTKTITDPTGATFTVNGGSSAISTSATGTIISSAGTGTISLSYGGGAGLNPTAAGAVAYAWYIDDGAGGAFTLQAVTLINSYKRTTPVSTTGQNGTAVTADHSANPGGGSGPAAFDGILYASYASSLGSGSTNYLPGAYVLNLATGTAGAGTKLTASGKGTVTEIDNMLISMWNNYQVSPTILFVNAQQLQDITTLCLSTASAPLLTYFADPEQGYQRLMAGGTIEFYFNPFTQGGGVKIPVMIHPFLPPGTIVGWAENLPMQYQSNEVPNVAEVHFRRDYYQIDWPARTRLFESGVYCEEALAVYAPFATGVIGNIAPGT